jgi:K+-sensing histidine kinase KdpD
LLLADMLQNLIDNAVRYTGSGGVITVSSGEDVGDAWLAVEDNGIGIPVSERTRVFERFYRGAAAGGDGCGLGLAIVKEGAERHRATVTIDDAPGGRGTLVRVHFPAASKPSSPSHEDAYATAEACRCVGARARAPRSSAYMPIRPLPAARRLRFLHNRGVQHAWEKP